MKTILALTGIVYYTDQSAVYTYYDWGFEELEMLLSSNFHQW